MGTKYMIINITNKKPFFGLLVLIMMGGFMTGCSLPPHLRYQYIDNVVKQVDYESAGEVKIARYDNGDGVFSPSFFRAEIIGGMETYEAIKKDLLKIDNIECPNPNLTGYMECEVGHVEVYLNSKGEKESDIVIFRVTDGYSGRADIK